MTLEGTLYIIRGVYSYSSSSPSKAGLLECIDVGKRWQGVFDGAFNRTRSFHSPKEPEASTGVKAGGATPQLAQVADDHGSTHANPAVLTGVASVISGTITSLTGQRGHRWEGGTFEYVQGFAGVENPGGIDPNAVWVRPHTYQLTFTRSSSNY